MDSLETDMKMYGFKYIYQHEQKIKNNTRA